MGDLNPHEQRLADVFAGEHASEAVGAWRMRDPRRLGAASSWLRPAAALLAAAIVAGGLGSYFGLRAHSSRNAAGSAAYPAARAGAAMAYDEADGTVVMFGGYDRRGRPLGDTWTWDGAGWSRQHPAHSPPASFGALMAYDPSSGSVLLLGGQTSGPFSGGPRSTTCARSSGSASGAPRGVAAPPSAIPNPLLIPVCGLPLEGGGTWAWDGGDWRHAGGGPGYLAGRAWMATDPRSGRPLLVAETGADALACAFPCAPELQAWTWTGSGWARSAGSSSGPLLDVSWEATALVIDPATDRSALLAETANLSVCGEAVSPGHAGASLPLSCPAPSVQVARTTGRLIDWTGSGWSSPRTLAALPLTFLGGAVFAAGPRQVLVLEPVALADHPSATWVWNGSGWSRHAGRAPVIEDEGAAAFDAGTGQLVLFGGLGPKTASSSLDDIAVSDATWTWDGSSWTQRGGAVPTVPPQVKFPLSTPPAHLGIGGVSGGGSGSGACSSSWSESRSGDGSIDLTFSSAGPAASCATTFALVDGGGRAVKVANSPLSVSSGTMSVVWSNWCGSQPVYLSWGSRPNASQGGGRSAVDAPSCVDPAKASTWTPASAAAPR